MEKKSARERSRDEVTSPSYPPLQNMPAARARAAPSAPRGDVAPSERQRATQRARRDVGRAPRTAGRPSVARRRLKVRPLCAMGGVAAPATCAAARARPWPRASAARDGPAPQAPHRPCAARLTRRGPRRSQAVRWSWPLLCAAAQGHAAGLGARARRARWARPRPLGCALGHPPPCPAPPGRRVAARPDRRWRDRAGSAVCPPAQGTPSRPQTSRPETATDNRGT